MDLPDRETLSVEFKRDHGLSDAKILDEVVALANTRGGTLYIGVEDDGTPSGAKGRAPVQMEAKIAANTVPPLQVRASVLVVEGARGNNVEVLAIDVPRSLDIVATSQGRATWRLLDERGLPITRPLYPYQMPHRLSDLGRLDLSKEAVVGATVEDLDVAEVVRLRHAIDQANNADAALLELDTMELLRALRIVVTEDGETTPTLTGLLMLGTEEARRSFLPNAQIVFQRLDGTRVVRDEMLPVPLVAAVERVLELVDLYNPIREFMAGPFSLRPRAFDLRAVREAVVNAVGHRDYSLPGVVRVLMDESGLTISNPGGFVLGISVKNLLTADPRGRNGSLMDALKRVGLAERTGRGVDRIFEGSLRTGSLLPSYEGSTLETVQLFLPEADPDWLFMEVLGGGEKASGVGLSVPCLFVLNILWHADAKLKHMVAEDEICAKIPLDKTRILAALQQLLRLGYLRESVGSSGVCYGINWERVSRWLGKDVRAGGAVSNRSGKSDESIVLALVKSAGSITAKNVREALGCDQNRASYLLRKLVDKGSLVKAGSGRNTRYLLAPRLGE